MKIKYISCDSITEVEEEIIKAEFYEIMYQPEIEIICTRSDNSEFIWCGKEFSIETHKILWIKN